MKHKMLPAFLLFFILFGEKLSGQSAFVIKSNDLGKHFTVKQIYDKYSCGGKNISPELHWKDAPAGTKSFAITMFDPDAPGKGWWHWLIFNIPANMNQLPAGAGSIFLDLLPPATIQSINDYKEYGYGGPCPPPGKPHRYVISLYALDTDTLGLDKNTPPEKVKNLIDKHVLAKTEMISLYGR